MHSTNSMRWKLQLAVYTAVVVLLASRAASAQTFARVLRDQTPIWQSGFLTIITVVNAGTELEVVRSSGKWIEVRLPRSTQGTTSVRIGFIAINQVELVARSVNPEPPEGRGKSGAAPEIQRPSTTPSRRAAGAAAARIPGAGLSVYGQIGYGRFAARQSFTAVLGQEDGMWFGGGGQFRFRNGLFTAVSLDRFQRTGERVFVTGANEVFRLGVEDTLKIVPLTATAGYFFTRSAIAPYVGAGVGRYFVSERSPLGSDEENIEDQFTSYHATVGVEWVGSPHFGTAFDLHYTSVPNSLAGDVPSAFGDKELGGLQARIRFLFR